MSAPLTVSSSLLIHPQIVTHDIRDPSDLNQAPLQGFTNPQIHGSEGFYAYNALQSFSFGTPQPPSASTFSQPIHPLSTGSAENSMDNVGNVRTTDVTPRPSVVAAHHKTPQAFTASHPTQPPGITPLYQSPEPEHSRRHVTHSVYRQHGDRSQSSSPSPSDSGTTHSRSESIATSQTTFLDSDDDRAHRAGGVGSTGTGESTVVEFSSDEDYDNDGDSDDSDDSDDGNDDFSIEVGSARFDPSIAAHEWPGRERHLLGSQVDSSRKGSLPIAIPGATSSSCTPDSSYFPPGRNREDSIVTVRRPSRSLDDKFPIPRLAEGTPNDPIGNAGIDRPHAPTSVPESDIDWRQLEERSKGKSRAGPDQDSIFLPSETSRHPSAPYVPPLNVAQDFNLAEWNQRLGGGITSFDPSTMGDVVGPTKSAKPSNTSNRHGSIWRIPTMFGSGTRRPSTATESSADVDSFGKALRSWDGDFRQRRRDWTFRREKDRNDYILAEVAEESGESISDCLAPRRSVATDRSDTSSSTTDTESIRLEKGRFPKPDPTWKGMPIGSQEVWKNELVGRFSVHRRSVKPADPAKGPQQRLVITLPPAPGDVHDNPIATIHKHSKAIAYSISRYSKSTLAPWRDGGALTVANIDPPTDGTLSFGGVIIPTGKRTANTVLLAPQHVQVAYTNTQTTRKLRSYGYLDDKKKKKQKQHGESGKNKNEGRNRDKERHRQRKQPTIEGKAKGPPQVRDDIEIFTQTPGGSSSRTLPAPPASAPSSQIHLPSSSYTGETIDNECAPSRNSSHGCRRRVRPNAPDDEDDETAAPTRTPHSEAFSTIDASTLERMRPDIPLVNHDTQNAGFLKRLLRGGRKINDANTRTPGQPDLPYSPNWVTLVPRKQQEEQARAVQDLNTSFKDVGLLTSPRRDRPNSKPKKIASGGSRDKDVFCEIPPDALCMLLPLWPGESISPGQRDTFRKPHIPPEERPYLLIFYIPDDEAASDQSKSRGEGESKKRSRNSPTSSLELSEKKEDQTSILLGSFHVAFRAVNHTLLQGTGIRIPEEGLTVSGPLDKAFECVPAAVPYSSDWVLAVCYSRESGVEFQEDGMVSAGLCTKISKEPENQVRSEDYSPPEPEYEVTPIGRAVMEMVWLGAMALTSIGVAG